MKTDKDFEKKLIHKFKILSGVYFYTIFTLNWGPCSRAVQGFILLILPGPGGPRFESRQRYSILDEIRQKMRVEMKRGMRQEGCTVA